MITYPIDTNTIHLFRVEDKRFAFDVNSCVFIELDELVWDVLETGKMAESQEELEQALAGKYSKEAVKSALDEIDRLASYSLFFSYDSLAEYHPSSPDDIATLCVNVSQACNLRCRYCFAGDGTFGQPTGLMKLNVAEQTVNFFLQNSGRYNNLSLCFFGGEPLLNFDIIQQMVEYAEKQGRAYGKTFRFNITTNGTQLNEHVRSFLASHKFGVIVSIDGERDVHDSMRPFANGQGSYDKIRSYLDAHQRERQTNETQWTLRATFTRHNLNFADQVFHLANLGFHDISVEPCASNDPDLGIGQNDLPTLKAEYSSFTKRYLKALGEGQEFSFFHLNVMLEQAKQGSQRLTQCGAGRGYLVVSAGGQLYPCHRLVGQEQYELGNVYEGIKYPERRQQFASAHVNSKSACRQCWARYICGGGCHAHAIQFNDDISVPYELECELMKQRIELGAYLWSVLSHDQQDNLNLLYDQALTNRPHLSGS